MIKYKLKFISTILVLCILTSVSATAFAEIFPQFEQTNYYDSSTYADVYDDDWYYYYVGFAYEYGIMTGTGDNMFTPDGNITLAEAITVASRLNAKYYGNTINKLNSGGSVASLDNNNIKYSYPISGNGNFQINDSDSMTQTPKTGVYINTNGVGSVNRQANMTWFMPYLEYAVNQGIIEPNQFSGRYLNPASREQLAYLLFKALPDCYQKINEISPIPDVRESNPYYQEILKLYESGVVTGSDEYGTFYPASDILRSEAAAMVSRIINTDLRISFSLNQDKPYQSLSYSWNYPFYGETFRLDVSISYYDYIYFVSKPRTNNYSAYAQDEADETAVYTLAETLRDMAVNNGFASSYDIAGFISAFVQSLEYQDDLTYKGVIEYPKYPIETLFDQGGDCEDSAVLLAKMLKLLGYGAVLLVSEDHMAVGLQTSSNGNLSLDGIQYYYIETTEPGWRIGDVPNDMVGVGMSVLYI